MTGVLIAFVATAWQGLCQSHGKGPYVAVLVRTSYLHPPSPSHPHPQPSSTLTWPSSLVEKLVLLVVGVYLAYKIRHIPRYASPSHHTSTPDLRCCTCSNFNESRVLIRPLSCPTLHSLSV